MKIQVLGPVLGVVIDTAVALGAGMGVGLADDAGPPDRTRSATPTINRSNRLVAISAERASGMGRGFVAQTLGAYKAKLVSTIRSRRENRLMAINKAPYGGLVAPCREVFRWETDACPTSVAQGILLKGSHQPSARGSSLDSGKLRLDNALVSYAIVKPVGNHKNCLFVMVLI